MATNKIKKVEQMLNKIIQNYQFSPKEKIDLDRKIKQFITELQIEAKKLKINAQVMLGGSAAKNTFIKDDFDCDIFVRFDYKQYAQKEATIAILLANILKKYSPAIIHGSRDYYHVEKDNIRYEIVPVLNVKDPKQAINVTDMSPLHVEWVAKNMTKQLRNEIILTKVFLKANNLYGAESYIKSFSGHVIDILLVQYKTFLSLLKASKKWKPYQVIDVEKHNTARWLNESKISPLIVIDPILPSRNAAAAISLEKINEFKKIAQEFLQKPTEDFFNRKNITINKLQQKLKAQFPKEQIFIIEITPLTGKEDIVLTKALKAFEHIKKEAKQHDFTIIDQNINFSNKQQPIAYFIVPKKALDKQKLIKGPPIKYEQGWKEFKQKHKGAFEKNKQLFAYEQRVFPLFKDFLENILKDEYITERIKKIKIIS